MGVEGIELNPLVKFRMNYGPNDNEISTLYEGAVDPATVRFDPMEIAEVYYYSLDELREMIEQDNTKFCSWFVELINWHSGKWSKMNLDFSV
jgi:isopentenyldiphosphate isomerase